MSTGLSHIASAFVSESLPLVVQPTQQSRTLSLSFLTPPLEVCFEAATGKVFPLPLSSSGLLTSLDIGTLTFSYASLKPDLNLCVDRNSW